MTRSIASWTSSSDWESRALVASSKSRMLGSTKRARAMAILCFCPPLSLIPRSPTRVSYPSGKPSIKLCALAILATSMILSRGGVTEHSAGLLWCFAAQP
mmetsp:Transcript_21236/g.42395  ORF Transcript_21236/g.42395 Transcript_21236/m.42395 type:complete len:100 (+) Transcript_21236:231-530(+)